MAKTLQKSRLAAFHAQHRRCYYCGCLMWHDEPTELPLAPSCRQATLVRCTAEHLQPKSEGGSNARTNIVAACLWCNRQRHARKRPLAPALYQRYVRRRIALGKWHLNQVGRALWN